MSYATYCVTDEDDNYAVTGQCLECGAAFIKGLMEGRMYDNTCISCGESMAAQRTAFDEDQTRRGRKRTPSGSWEISEVEL